MKKYFLILFLLASASTYAQVNSVSNRVTGKLGFSFSDNEGQNTFLPNFRSEITYGFARVFEVGAYAGFGFYQSIIQEQNGDLTSTFISGYAGSNYGLTANFHILPLIVKEKKLRFDLYVSGKLGTINPEKTDASPLPDKFFSDYGVYAGAAYYFTRHFGVYGEFGYGSYTNLRYGLSFKF